MAALGLLLIVALFARSSQALGTYTIVAPKVLRPNSEYHVSVSVQGTSEPTEVRIEVGGRRDNGGNFFTNQAVTVAPFSTTVAKLDIGDLGPGSYNLSVEGSRGLEFKNSSRLDYVHKSYSVLVQTDKAIYKPGDLVRFRALVLNAHLKPLVTGTIEVYITDGKGNRVKQWPRALPKKGVFSGELELSTSPVLGDWVISVTVMDQKFTKGFQVAEYVLPKFQVTIDAPKHATFKDSRVHVTIHAKYTYGKPVKGEATITAFPTIFSGLLQPAYQPVRKVVPIDGKATADFEFANDFQLTEEFEREIKIEVTVEEQLTGRRQNVSSDVILHKHKYKMELVRSPEYFKPGLIYKGFLKLSHHDGTPVIDKTNPVIMKYGFSFDNENFTEERFFLTQDGLIEFTYYPPKNSTTLNFEAKYLDLQEWFSGLVGSISPSGSFIQLSVVTENPRVNEDLELLINSTHPLKYLNYQVLGRGDIILANTIRVLNSSHSARIRFLASFAMAPTAHVVVHYVTEDGEVVADSLDIEISGAMQNTIRLSASPEEVQPGDNVDVVIDTKPNAYVGILGVDQSVLLLRDGNDISREDVLKELRSYDSVKDFSEVNWPMRSGSSSAQEVFDNSGTVILSNGLVFEHTPLRFVLAYAGAPAPPTQVYYRSNAFEPLEESALDGLALPDASGIGAGQAAIQPPRTRSHFPETWLWEMLDAGADGRVSLSRKKAPDTITSWVITGFSIDPVYGLGLTEMPSKLRVYRPFFVSLDLPYHVIRGEIVAVPIVVFNYMDKEITATVTLENHGLEEFEFAEISNDVGDTTKVELYRRKQVQVKPQSGASVSFMIVPKKLGYVTIKVSATSPFAGDAVERKLLVRPEGETQYVNKAVFIDLRDKNSFNEKIQLDIPKNIVYGSEYLEVSAVGDILGPSIPNLEKLIQLPSGCGEQNMLNFVPNIVIIEYLKNTNQLTQAVESRAIGFLEKGYQQELTYRHSDGSFSAFGESDDSGSTWLTAFVAKSFHQASRHISVDEQVILDALHWLASQQRGDGAFPEVGKVIHSDMQGAAGEGLALTAYTLITFLEIPKGASQYRNTINKALDYIAKKLPDVDDPYAIALCAYALHRANHAQKDSAFNLLEAKAKTNAEMRWWEKVAEKGDEKNPWSKTITNGVNVEMSAYALMTYLERGLDTDSLPNLRWIVAQRNANGGFVSTQDTVIGIEALARLGERLSRRSSPAGSVSVTFQPAEEDAAPVRVNVSPNNAIILQKNELPSKTRSLNITATGSGLVIAQVSYRYNVNVTGAWPRFTLDPQVDKNSNINHLQLSICSAFVSTASTNESNMAVMEVSLPSGFTADQESLPSLRLSEHVRRVETKEGDTVIMLYFDKMTKQEYCPTIRAYRSHKVANQKPVPVSIYDYYDSSRRARVFYEPRTANLCDICEDEECSRLCSGKPPNKIGFQNSGDKDSASFKNSASSHNFQISLFSFLSIFSFAYFYVY